MTYRWNRSARLSDVISIREVSISISGRVGSLSWTNPRNVYGDDGDVICEIRRLFPRTTRRIDDWFYLFREMDDMARSMLGTASMESVIETELRGIPIRFIVLPVEYSGS